MGDAATLSILPSWAQATLQQHAEDKRREVLPLEVLAGGKTGNHVWDAMQRYLLETGELHNNARMGWGKAILAWSESPENALERLLHLNHRFALDGHAPPSYGGVLGCFGLFESPKRETSVYGKVSPKALKPKYAQLSSSLLDKVVAHTESDTTSCRPIESLFARSPAVAAAAR